MRTNGTAVKLTKLASAGIISAIKKTTLPWLTKHVWPWGKYVGAASLMAPTLTYGINKIKGYDPGAAAQRAVPQLDPDNILDFVRRSRLDNPLEVGLRGMHDFSRRNIGLRGMHDFRG